MKDLSSQTKWIIYAGLNFGFWTFLIIGSAIGGGSLGQLPYVAVLFALCSSPIPFIGRLNGAAAMLGAAMAVYFVEFGALDAMSIVIAPAKPTLGREGSGSPTSCCGWAH